MSTKELTDLMRALWQNEELPSKLESFLALSREAYQKGRSLKDWIDWEDLNTTHSWEEFGRGCSVADEALERMGKGERPPKNIASRPGTQLFQKDARFRAFCREALKEFQERARRQMEESVTPPPPRKERIFESERESLGDFNNIYDATKDYATSAFRLKKRTEQLKIEALNAQRAAESIIPNMLTTLGIFIAIVVAVVGCYLSLILSRLNSEGSTPAFNLSACLVMGHILVSIIFLLMYLISKQTSHTMACYCHIGSQMDCSMCHQKIRSACKLPNRIWLRYPYVVLLNGVFLLSYAFLGLWQFARAYLGEEIDQIFTTERQAVIVCAVLLLVLPLLAAAGSLLFMAPGKKLREAMSLNQPKNTGLTIEQTDLVHQVSDLAGRVESLEALYEGRDSA